MPIHIGDYKRDTGHLYAAEHGAYLLLLFHHWSTGALPDDDRQLAAIACMSASEWKRTKPVLAPFFQPGWIHGRIIEDLKKAKESYDRRAQAGKEGGKAKATRKQSSSNATAMPKQPLTTNHEEDRIGDAGASAFTEGSKALASAFWKALGFDSPLAVPPEYAGTDWRAVEWERAGWTVDLIDAVARKTGKKPLSYHEKCFATEFAKRQAPLPVVEIKQAEKLTVTHGNSQNRTGGSLTDSIRRELAELEQQESGNFALPTGSILRISG